MGLAEEFSLDGVAVLPVPALALAELETVLAGQTYHKRGERIIARMPAPGKLLLDRMGQFRKMAIALTAVEARYLPNLDPKMPMKAALLAAGVTHLESQDRDTERMLVALSAIVEVTSLGPDG